MNAPLGVSVRRQTTDVDAMLTELRLCERPHDVEVSGLPLHVLPGVLSPRLSHGFFGAVQLVQHLLFSSPGSRPSGDAYAKCPLHQAEFSCSPASRTSAVTPSSLSSGSRSGSATDWNLPPLKTSSMERRNTDLLGQPAEAPKMDLFSFTECATRTQCLRSLFELLVSCASDEGFSEVSYGALNFAEPLRLPEYPPPAVAVKWPPEWCERYFKRKYHKIDPVVRRTPTLSRPFLWDQLAEQYQLQPDERRVLDEAREAGLKHGMSVPLFGPLGRLSVVSFASRFDDADPQHSKGHLNALAWHFHTACVEITRPAEDNCNMRVALSQRELDCLRWVAEGKSSWEIGRILQISENTVNFHLKNAMRKLGATSRIQAAIVAIRLNLIFDVHVA